MNFCSHCGAGLMQRIPAGDDRLRFVCDQCQTIHYQNPRMVVGTIPEWKDRILLCRRAIEPRAGLWTLPAGYLENGETMIDGARRETREEAGAILEALAPFALFDLPLGRPGLRRDPENAGALFQRPGRGPIPFPHRNDRAADG